jgi:threonylcarbamoyladenosine tRNA methylthiotransferase MtaB
MTEDLINAGYVEEKDNNIPADIYIINTCSVTNTADSKSLKLIRQAIKKNKDAIIVVCGCLAQVKPETVNIEGVDIVIGNKNKSKVSEYINEYVKNKNKKTDIYDISNVEFETMKLNNFDKTRAFIKIQDGCNNFCAYCIIPYTRGSVRSKPREDILNEIDHLTLNGHKEIVLTGIHTGNYGSEFDNYDFADLLNEIVKIKKLSRIRISSIEITELNDRVLEIIKNNNVLVDHLHIPLQSGSDEILKLMNRKYDTKYFIEKINKIRKIRPDISITTDVIVGFPNETDKNFNETIETIKKVDFSKLHVFPYSKREGTKAATMEGQIKEEVKKQRVMELLKLSKELENKYMNKFIGKTLTFIPEVYKDGYLIGHTGNYLLIKLKGCEELLHKEVSVKLMENQYPYIISSAI